MKSEFEKSEKIKVTTILFDLDGTLIDTEPSAAQAVQDCYEEWKIKIDQEDATYVTGRTWESGFEYLFRKYPPPISENLAAEMMMARYRKILDESLCVVPGSARAVQSLATRFSLGLVSGSRRQEVLWALDQLKIRNHFQLILGAEDYLRSKPQPDGYLKAIQTLGATPTSCLVFEDSTAGITSARAAGVWVVAVTSTNHFRQDTSQAHFEIADLENVDTNWVNNLSFD